MFNNIGKKIKTLATVITWVGIILSIVGFLVMLILGAAEDEWLVFGLSFVVLVVGVLGSWIGSFILYGLGELIDNSAKTVDLLSGANNTMNSNKANDSNVNQTTQIDANTIEIGESTIGYRAYYGCRYVKVILKEGVNRIDISAFANSKALKEVGLPNTLKYIGDDAFFGCASLTTIFIPKSVEIIEARAFYGCKNLVICCEAEVQPEGWSNDWNITNSKVFWNVKREAELIDLQKNEESENVFWNVKREAEQ